MRNRAYVILIIFSQLILSCSTSIKKTNTSTNIDTEIDSLLANNSIRPFNGSILISRNDSVLYQKSMGYSDFEKKILLSPSSQFVIGSLSKQITSVLILKAYEDEKLKLQDPLRKFIPHLTMKWADSVTVHHLLNHTHGIDNLDTPLKFRPGTGFAYSNLGYELLGEILEQVHTQTYENLVNDLFKKLNMKHSRYPNLSNDKILTKGNSKQENGEIIFETKTFTNESVPAGLLLSNTADLVTWNKYLHTSEFLKKRTYELMISPTAKQNHSLFGNVGYGYGIRISDENSIKEIGHTGYVPGYISMNFYYPKTQTSIIVLENLDWE